MKLDDKRTAWNARAAARLWTSAGSLPAPVLAHALRARWMPRTLRAAVDHYWRAHPLRAERLARALAGRSGRPLDWQWTVETSTGFRLPPLPYRTPEGAAGPGQCVICGEPVYRLGWHVDLWDARVPNPRAAWHSACVVAWKFWTAPCDHRTLLSRLQGRRCALSGRRLLKSAEVDHRVPLFAVWRDHRHLPWPELLAFWGLPNLQVMNTAMHAEKSADELRGRVLFRASILQAGAGA